MKLWIGKCKTQNIVILHSSEPYYMEEFDRWDSRGEGFITSFIGNNFPKVTYENSPQQVELKLVKE